MTEQQFCYWLQGYFELGQASELNTNQVQVVKDHLKLVFKKETPTYVQPSWETTIQPQDAPVVPLGGYTKVTC